MSGLAAWIGWNLAGRLDIQCLYHGFGATYPTYLRPEFAQIAASYLPTMCRMLPRPGPIFFFKSSNFRFLLSPFSAQISQSFRVKNSQMRGLWRIFRCCEADTYSV